MAKVAFTKLNKVKKLPVISKYYNDLEIEFEQYLPLEEKLTLITSVIEQSGNGEEGFFNIVKLEAYYRIEMIRAYTNITFTEKQLEDTPKLFDAIELNDVWAFVEDNIPQKEREYIWNTILALAREITTYNNSVLGLIKAIQNQAVLDPKEVDLEKIQNELQGIQNSTLVQQVLPLIGQ